ncbi:MAG: PIN domain-containing protein [Candidatus Lokiarchaeota archaeon]|nr:PIN domain-containing protein [Candidatus Lokiarchaeota archaeon]
MPIFDTTFLIDLTRGDVDAISTAKQVDETTDIKAVSVVTVHEYLRGVYYHHIGKKTLDDKLRKAFTDLAHFEQLEFTTSIAREAAYIDALLLKQGNKVPYADVVVAATSKHHNIPLVTRDSHFKVVDGIVVIDY